jgi:uncharacterized membrane-anchored protein
MTRRRWIWALGVVVLLFFNGLIVQQEMQRASAETAYFALRPVDPRSLMQGDYMRLDYEVAAEIGVALDEAEGSARQEGTAVVRLDERQVAHFERIWDGGELGPDERLVDWGYRKRIYIGANSFMFQEGRADAYAHAEFAEMKLSDDGRASLIGLRDAALKPIEPLDREK